jgi:hypothetical protein
MTKKSILFKSDSLNKIKRENGINVNIIKFFFLKKASIEIKNDN